MSARSDAESARFARKHALGCARKLTTNVHAYRRVQLAREAMPPALRDVFDAHAVKRMAPRQIAKERRIPLDKARGLIAAAYALLNGDLGLPPSTALIS